MNLLKGLLSLPICLLGVAAQAQTYFSDDFSSSNWKSNYDMSYSQNFKHVNSGCYSGSCIQVTVHKNSHYGGSAKYKLKEHLGFEPEEMYAEYRVNYDRSMSQYGGKAPGFDGTYGVAGWGNRPGYGTNGWSARGTLRAKGRSDVRNSFYIYHTDTGNNGKTWGDARWWNNDGNMDFNRWYHVKQYVKLNTPGQNNGILRAWVDGEKVFEKTDFNFRTVNSLKIYAYWINYYNGGSDEATATGTVKIDDLVLYGPQGKDSSGPSNPGNGNQTAYINHLIPGKIEVEHFDLGGQGTAYSDSNSNNSGGAFRESEGVDIQSTSDSGGGYNVGWVSSGEWLEYTVGNVSSGTYDIKLRVAVNGVSTGKNVVAKLGGREIGEFVFSSTGGWQTWETVTIRNVSIDNAANQVLRLELKSGGMNINWIEFVRSNDDGGGAAPSVVVQAESFTSTGGAYGGFDTYTLSSGVVATNYNQRGDWAEYRVQVPESGRYKVEAWLATTQSNGAIEVFVNGVSRTKKTVPNNGNWDNYVKLVLDDTVQLNAGTQTIRIQSSGTSSSTWEWNADRFVFTKQ